MTSFRPLTGISLILMKWPTIEKEACCFRPLTGISLIFNFYLKIPKN